MKSRIDLRPYEIVTSHELALLIDDVTSLIALDYEALGPPQITYDQSTQKHSYFQAMIKKD